MIRTSTLQADLRTIPDARNVGRRTLVAIAPSDADPISDEMRVAAGGVMVMRAFDPGEPIVTGAPIALLTEAGDALVTEALDHIVSEVSV